jgi:hypothetical protein
MKRYAPLAIVVGALAVALAVLLLTEGDRRTIGYRIVIVLVGLGAIRLLFGWHGAHPRPPEPLRRRRWSWRPRRPHQTARRGSERVLHLATVGAGDAHRGLRPLLQEVADERLRARHGVALTDAGAPALLAPATWAFLDPDRPAPHDLRAAGLTPAAIDDLLTDLESI